MSSRGERSRTGLDGPVFVPETLGEALQILRKRPSLQIWGGGTWWSRNRDDTADILALHHVKELRRVVRSDIQVEVGSTVPIERLYTVGRRFLPKLVIEALHQIGPPPVRNLATLGGAVSIPGLILPVTACLQMIDTRLELRRQGNARWVTLNQFRDPGGGVRINRGEIVTRLRIPLQPWTHWTFQNFGVPFPAGQESLSIIGAAAIDKAGINEFRFVLVIDGAVQVRIREAEMDLVGRSVPLTERERRSVLNVLESNPYFGSELTDLGRWRAANGLREFLRKLG
ncbi:MAG: FAD binding domain-containing protein [Alkalispirochaeta sp.]